MQKMLHHLSHSKFLLIKTIMSIIRLFEKLRVFSHEVLKKKKKRVYKIAPDFIPLFWQFKFFLHLGLNWSRGKRLKWLLRAFSSQGLFSQEPVFVKLWTDFIFVKNLVVILWIWNYHHIQVIVYTFWTRSFICKI